MDKGQADAPTVQGQVAPGQAPGLPRSSPAIPVAIGRFEVLGVLGAGGMGVVYRGFDRTLAREVALKLVNAHGGAEGQTRLLREAQAMARVAHPNVVPVYEVGLHGDGVFVAMELVKGQTLGAWLRAEPRGWRDILRKLVDAGRGLEAVHRTGILHRDFKPENVLIGEDGRARVVDFGLARAEHDLPDTEGIAADSPLGLELTQQGLVVGTPAFMSPEHLEGSLTPLADQWSFAVTCYVALFGELPFTGDNVDALRAAILEAGPRPPKLGDVPVEIAAAVLRGMHRFPEQRFASLGAMLDALEAPLAVDPDNDKNVSRRQRRMFGTIVAALALAFFVATGLRTHFDFDLSTGGVFIQSLFGLAFVTGGLFAYRRAFLRTAHDRKIAASLLISLLAMVAHRAVAYAGDAQGMHVLRGDAVFLVAMMGYVAATIEPFAVLASIPMVVWLVISFLAPPGLVFGAFGLAMFAIIAQASFFWREPKVRDLPATGSSSQRTRSLRKQ